MDPTSIEFRFKLLVDNLNVLNARLMRNRNILARVSDEELKKMGSSHATLIREMDAIVTCMDGLMKIYNEMKPVYDVIYG